MWFVDCSCMCATRQEDAEQRVKYAPTYIRTLSDSLQTFQSDTDGWPCLFNRSTLNIVQYQNTFKQCPLWSSFVLASVAISFLQLPGKHNKMQSVLSSDALRGALLFSLLSLFLSCNCSLHTKRCSLGTRLGYHH